jgi:ubiquitin-protein ligase
MSSAKKGGFDAGTGYGGVDGTDKEKLLAGRKKAAQQETKHDKESQKFLQKTHTELLKAIRTQKEEFLGSFVETSNEESTKLVKLLQEIFRNQVPADWVPRNELYQKALEVCETLASNETLGVLLIRVIDDDTPSETAKIEIEESDDETVLSSLTMFADLADCVQRSSQTTAAEKKFAAHVVQVKTLVEETAVRVKAQHKKNASILSVTTPEDIYKKELGPLRFDLCPSLSHHYFLKGAASGSTPASRARVLFKELTSYKTALPIEYGSSIFVRVVEDKLDTLRALILGPDETPYANGCYIFDISLPSNYPQVAPKVHFVNHGNQRFNPNLYNCGKVCLSLLGTWRGPGWVSGESTLLQVLISIQSLILVNDPYFNEPGYEASRGTPRGDEQSAAYNKRIQSFTLNHSLLPILKCLAENKPTLYPEFDDVFLRHFLRKRVPIDRQLSEWSNLDPSVRYVVNMLRGHLQTLAAANQMGSKPASKRKRATAPIYNVSESGVIEIDLDSGKSKRKAVPAAAAKKPGSPNEVVSLLDEDDSQGDSKVPAVSTSSNNSNAAAGGNSSDLVDLT